MNYVGTYVILLLLLLHTLRVVSVSESKANDATFRAIPFHAKHRPPIPTYLLAQYNDDNITILRGAINHELSVFLNNINDTYPRGAPRAVEWKITNVI